MKKETQKICLVTTVYSLFLYFLINGFNKEDIFIFTSGFPESVAKNIKHIRTRDAYFREGPKMAPLNSISGIIKNITGYFNFFYSYIQLRILLFFKLYNKEVEVYGHAQTPFSFMFYENKNSNIIEDGTLNYCIELKETHKINPFLDILLHICGIYILSQNEAFGTHEYIQNVYLTHSHDDPLINDKIKVLDIKKEWNKLSGHDKNNILRVFNLNTFSINNSNKETVLFITEPLSEDDLITLDAELEIYKELIEKFNDKRIIIKPHPRETKNYLELFPNVEVLEDSFPIELLELIGFTPDIVCSVCSTALLNFNHSEIYMHTGEINSEKINLARNFLMNNL